MYMESIVARLSKNLAARNSLQNARSRTDQNDYPETHYIRDLDVQHFIIHHPKMSFQLHIKGMYIPRNLLFDVPISIIDISDSCA